MEELSRQMFLEVVDLHNTQVHIYPIYLISYPMLLMHGFLPLRNMHSEVITKIDVINCNMHINRILA